MTSLREVSEPPLRELLLTLLLAKQKKSELPPGNPRQTREGKTLLIQELFTLIPINLQP